MAENQMYLAKLCWDKQILLHVSMRTDDMTKHAMLMLVIER